MPAFKRINKKLEPKEITNEIIEKICNHLRLGHYIETAVIMAGISKKRFYEYIKNSHKEEQKGITDSICIRLRDAVETAQGECETRDLLIIDLCAQGRDPEFLKDDDGKLVLNENGNPIFKVRGLDPDWSASAWRLERRFPKKWGSTRKIELTGEDGGAIEVAEETAEQKKERQKRIKEYLKKMAILNEPK